MLTGLPLLLLILAAIGLIDGVCPLLFAGNLMTPAADLIGQLAGTWCLPGMLAGRVPARGEVIKHPEGPEFEVIDADPRRIKRLRIRTGASRRAQAAE